MNEVAVRATMADTAKAINIYQGHIRESGNRNVLTLVIRRGQDGNFPAAQLEYVSRLKGNFTAVLMPGREYFYISSSTGRPNAQHEIFNWSPFNDDTPSQDLGVLVQRIVDLEKENDALREENSELKDELSGLETGADKFSYALEQLFYKVAPKLGLGDFTNNQKSNRSMNAPDEENDWRTFDVSGNTEEDVQRALGVLLFAFGEDYVLRFARKLQQNPSLVNTLKSMI